MASKRAYFQQEEPHLGNQYTEDTVLVELLHRKVPQETLKKARTHAYNPTLGLPASFGPIEVW